MRKLREQAMADAEACASKVARKRKEPYADAILKDVEAACGFSYSQSGRRAFHAEFIVMLDHAARRVSAAQTWIRRAEEMRKRLESDAQRIDRVPQVARQYLDRYRANRSRLLGSEEGYRIRPAAVAGWSHVIEAWTKKDCHTRSERVAAVRALQDSQVHPEIEKLGDMALFEALADDEAVCVWKPKDKGDAEPLMEYVSASEADYRKRYFKVPAYRHPDKLHHPVFCDFGDSRWSIKYGAHEVRKCDGRRKRDSTGSNHSTRSLRMGLWNGASIEEVDLRWQSKRLANDLLLD